MFRTIIQRAPAAASRRVLQTRAAQATPSAHDAAVRFRNFRSQDQEHARPLQQLDPSRGKEEAYASSWEGDSYANGSYKIYGDHI
eukprot:TRINITY_DN34664_c0_g1_i1.p1 TRINITY_DN34664_c0_g1~~TRINITY_DN34664_c0_g1_i1.p1  ORF type:complete len:100 (+),score=23.91 TRINITY_DN34664_c0_g1_i1:46-300(+)